MAKPAFGNSGSQGGNSGPTGGNSGNTSGNSAIRSPKRKLAGVSALRKHVGLQ